MNTNQIFALTTTTYGFLDDIASENPEFFINGDMGPLRKKLQKMADESGEDNVDVHNVNRKFIPQASLDFLVDNAVAGPESDYDHAMFLRKALPTVSAADMSDRRLLASICCFHLTDYVSERWKSSRLHKSKDQQKQAEFVKLHWLGDSKQANSVARIWWLYEFAFRAAKESLEYDGEVLLQKMAKNVNFYHQILRRSYLMASDKIRAAVLDVAIGSGLADRNNTKEVSSMMEQLNRIAGGMSLDNLSPQELREKVEEALPPK